MALDELTPLVLNQVGATWDELPEPRASLADLDLKRVRSFSESANEVGRRPIMGRLSPARLLDKLDLVKHGKLTRAAVLLFGKNPQTFYPQAVVKAGRFKDDYLILDDREIEGNLSEQVEGAMAYLRERLQTRFEITGAPQRKVIWEYPLNALREAVINAICHRDYFDGGQTQLRLYDDRLLVWNPGGLPNGISIDDLKKDHRSIPRNRLIARIFYYAGLIERWGTGIGKMLRESAEAGLPEPEFEERNGLRVLFRRPEEQDARAPQAPRKYPASTPQVLRLLRAARRPPSREALQAMIGLKDREHFRREYLKPLLAAGWLELTIPEKPLSSRQRYRTTAAGLQVIMGEDRP
jgi:ATP-dependent DNA helicase RecG